MTDEFDVDNDHGNAGEESQEIPPHSHVLRLADGSVSYYDASENTHGPVPTEVNGVPVVSVTHAYGGQHE